MDYCSTLGWTSNSFIAVVLKPLHQKPQREGIRLDGSGSSWCDNKMILWQIAVGNQSERHEICHEE